MTGYNKSSAVSGIKLCELKERIYKTLCEYSVNGEEIRDSYFEKADMEERMLVSINTAVTKAVRHLPVYTLSSCVYFPEIKPLCRKNAVKLSSGETLCLGKGEMGEKTALVMRASGNAHVSVVCGNTTVSTEEINSELCGEITKYGFLLDTKDDSEIVITAGDTGIYIDRLYTANGEYFDGILSSLQFPDDGKTFAKINDDIAEITYAERENKSIPVYKYAHENGCVYTDAENFGRTELHYTPKPCVFTEESCEDEMLLLPDITVCAIVYLAASELCTDTDSGMYNLLSYKYRDVSLNCYDRQKHYSRNSFYGTGKEKLSVKGSASWDM